MNCRRPLSKSLWHHVTCRLLLVWAFGVAYGPNAGHAAESRAPWPEAAIAQRLERANLGGPIAQIVPMRPGYSGAQVMRLHMLDGRELFAKVMLAWSNDIEAAAFAAEAAHAQAAAAMGFAPEVYAVDAANGVLVTDYLTNAMGDWRQGGHEPRLSATLMTMAMLHQSAPAGPVTPYAGTAARRNWANQMALIPAADEHDVNIALAVSIAQRCIDRLEAHPFAPTPRHGDLHPNNVRLVDGRAWFIDWAQANYGDPMEELANYIYHVGADVNQAPALGSAYGPFAPWAQERMQLHLALHHALRYVKALRGMPWDNPLGRQDKLAITAKWLREDDRWLSELSLAQP